MGYVYIYIIYGCYIYNSFVDKLVGISLELIGYITIILELNYISFIIVNRM